MYILPSQKFSVHFAHHEAEWTENPWKAKMIYVETKEKILHFVSVLNWVFSLYNYIELFF